MEFSGDLNPCRYPPKEDIDLFDNFTLQIGLEFSERFVELAILTITKCAQSAELFEEWQ